ncbi:metallophosphoesterase family protein [Bacillus sp. Marseille-P3800]|uniref:metallophosphoesterase family protein n=1 Tax=Bacillus sp. Marseille-P3800 TaxID=2014782 RepID=UPI000C08368D|nr:metallophosphoesterase [Bacillus sp. Marseille-P3800]
MKIDYVSDIHINHWMLWTQNQKKWEQRTRQLANRLIENGNGEVLIVAGDFSEWNDQSIWFLEEVAKSYERVYFTYGNHDLYLLSKSQRKKYGDSIGRLKDLVERASSIPNVQPLVKSADEYKGVKFAGDAMWYLPKSTKDWDFFFNVSNDSNHIMVNGYHNDDATRLMWKESQNWYDTLEGQHIDVFVSHVPPVHNPFTYFEPNSLYQTDVPFINAKHWICGHDHQQGSFEKAGVNFHMNCIGYPSEYDRYPELNKLPYYYCDTHKTYEVKTIIL